MNVPMIDEISKPYFFSNLLIQTMIGIITIFTIM